MSVTNHSAGFFLENILPKLGCHLFPARAKLDSPHLKINNATFNHWKKIWEEILQLPESGGLPSDTFLRQDLICSITNDQRVIGMIAASFFALDQEAYAYHSYLKPFLASSRFAKGLPADHEIMSIEYLSVDPAFRKGELGISLGSVLLGLSMEIFRQSNSAMVLGTARSKIHVDEMCYKFGFSPVGEMDKFGHPCTLIVNTKESVQRHNDLLVHRAVSSLWEGKENYFETAARKKAA